MLSLSKILQNLQKASENCIFLHYSKIFKYEIVFHQTEKKLDIKVRINSSISNEIVDLKLFSSQFHIPNYLPTITFSVN